MPEYKINIGPCQADYPGIGYRVNIGPDQNDGLDPPKIIGQSPNTTIFRGKFLSLFVLVTGTEPLLYQWYKDGNILPGKISDTLPFYANMSDAGTYKCIVTNFVGEVESNPIIVTVLPNPYRYNLFGIRLDQGTG